MQNVSVTPVIGTVAAGLACVTTVGSAVVTSTALFGSVLVGQKVYGVGIPFGAKVVTVTSTSSVTLDKNATATGTPTLQFSYFASTAYSAGDNLGWVFQIPLKKISNIFVIDAIKQITAVKLYVFNAVPAPVLDNAAFAPADADANKLIGYYSLTGTVALTSNHVIFPADTELPLAVVGSDTGMYGQLVVVGTPTFTAVGNIVVNFTGEEI